MGQVIPRQHPAVVLKSHYKAVRALLAVALIAIVALAATVVILANDDNDTQSSVATRRSRPSSRCRAGTRFDGGPDEGTRGIQADVPPPGYALRRRPRRGHPRPAVQAQSAQPALQLPAP